MVWGGVEGIRVQSGVYRVVCGLVWVYLWGLYGIIWGYIYIKVGESMKKWEFFVGF